MSASRILVALKARPLSEVASYGVILVRNALYVTDCMRTLDRDALEPAFAGCFDALRPAGELIIGSRNYVRRNTGRWTWPAWGPRGALASFYIGALGWSQHLANRHNWHVFDFNAKP